ncbi:NAD(P)H-hydrate dehydratase [Luteolibacter sp. AS25]|uniref:NAD(P)H-hydrate dehydratase n=1 Tax=Luteolibacter sp. AS25 TaxID=3135776 RepID=UPI00398B6284
MKAVSVEEMRGLERVAMESGISERELMRKAGRALGMAIGRQYPDQIAAVAYLGKGHNAGDALIALGVLRDEFGFEVGVRAGYPVAEMADLTREQWMELGLDCMLEEGFEKDFPAVPLMLDGLLGIGAKGALREPLAGLAREMRRLRDEAGAVVLAVDLPSGVDPDSGEIHEGAVVADRTYMIGSAKAGLLKAGAANGVGSLAVVAVEGLAGAGSGMEMVAPQCCGYGKTRRDYDFHKGKAGRVGIVAGSREFSGAAVMSALGAVRAGGGLVTVYARTESCDAIRGRLPLEVMLKACDNPAVVLDERLDAVVVGPGLGKMDDLFETGLMRLISETEVPMVIDADGLNLVSRKGMELSGRHVVTPHPGEFARLVPELDGVEREEAAVKFVSKTEAVLLLKGARTVIAKARVELRINATGTPAMSNGGQGDLLSGVIGALLGGGMDRLDAASLGAWLCGCAAELSESEKGEPTTATDVAGYLGLALRAWRRGER